MVSGCFGQELKSEANILCDKRSPVCCIVRAGHLHCGRKTRCFERQETVRVVLRAPLGAPSKRTQAHHPPIAGLILVFQKVLGVCLRLSSSF